MLPPLSSAFCDPARPWRFWGFPLVISCAPCSTPGDETQRMTCLSLVQLWFTVDCPWVCHFAQHSLNPLPLPLVESGSICANLGARVWLWS